MTLQEKLDNLKIINNHYVINPNLTLSGNVFLDHKYKFMKEKFFDKIEGKRYLDIGCNAGYFPILALQLGAKETYGIDASEEYMGIAKEVAAHVGAKPNLFLEKFSEDILRFGSFDAISLNSLYHYLFLDIKNHETIFRIISLMTENLFFENPLGMEDPVILKLSGQEGKEILKTEYTKEKILGAASKFFHCEYLADHLYPDRKIYWMTRKRGALDLTQLTSKKQVHANWKHTYYSVTLPGISRDFFLKRRVDMPQFPVGIVAVGTQISMNQLNHVDGLVKCYDYCIDGDGAINVLMEFLHGYENIYSVKKERKIEVLLDMIRMLSAAAKKGFYNIDPSPLNFFHKDKEVKMIDLDGLRYFEGSPESLLAISYSRIMDILKWF